MAIVWFRLKKRWSIDGKLRELWPMFLSGEKTSEWRDIKPHWTKQLEKDPPPTRAHFTIGYAKGNLPRLEADIVAILKHEDTGQYEIQVTNVVEVLTETSRRLAPTGKHPDVKTQIIVPEEFKPLIEDIRELLKDGQNPNQMTKSKREGLWRSLKKFGWFKPILVDGEGLLGDGEQRLEACMANEEFYAPVLRLDVDDKDRRLLRQIANKLRGTHDPDLDAAEYRRIVDEGGQRDLVQILQLREKELREALENVNLKVDDYEIPPLDSVQTDIQRGDRFQCGPHIVMCGDCTDPVDVDTLIGDRVVELYWTDPPYGINYAEKVDYLQKAEKTRKAGDPIVGDDLNEEQLEQLLRDTFKNVGPYLNDYNSFYITFAGTTLRILLNALHAEDWGTHQILVWNKNRTILGRSDYRYKHELMAYGWKGRTRNQHEFIVYGWKIRHKFYGYRDPTVWDIPAPSKSELHPTMKPVELIERSIVNSTLPQMTVLDTFLGSGTTLIACEKTVRKCLTMEIEPRYVQIAIDRWSHYTGDTPEKI